MANPSRKMATVRRIDAILPIPDADRIEVAKVGGWQVVVGKGEFSAGEPVVFYEIDTFMPTDNQNYAFLAERGTKDMVVDGRPTVGHVLKTARLRGVYSQGLVLKPSAVLPSSIPEYAYEKMADRMACVDSLVGVCEYVKPQADTSVGFVGKYDPFIAPRTDAERIQNIDQRTFDLIKRTEYEVSVKVDGTSVSMVFDDRTNSFRIFSHNNEFDVSEGMGKIAYDCATGQGLRAFCEANHMTTLQAELCGPKIQSDRLGLGRHRLFVFSIWDMAECKYVSCKELDGRIGCQDVLDSHVPIVSTGTLLDKFDTPDGFLSYVDGIKGNVTKGRLDEGLVTHIYDKGAITDEQWMELRRTLSATMQVKAVSNKFLLKAKE